MQRNDSPASVAGATHTAIRQLMDMIQQAVVIEPAKLELILAALLAQGHVLLEDYPGMGKTLVAKALARSLHATFKRVQCTPDLLPADITGGAIYNQREQKFEFVAGPIFANIVLVDEINRASPRTQSSLLESMAEGQVTSDGFTRILELPFFIIATQNPVEMAGTFPLPEAQLDRFLFKIKIGYLPRAEEIEVLRRYHTGFDAHDLAAAGLTAAINPAQLVQIRQIIKHVRVEDGILNYITAITEATRKSSDLALGASTRAGVWLLLAAKTYAALRGRDYVSPDDIKFLVPPVMRHRVYLRPEAEIEGMDSDGVFRRLLNQIEVPR